MRKMIFFSSLVLSCLMAQSSTVDSGAISSLIAETFNLRNLRFQEPVKLDFARSLKSAHTTDQIKAKIDSVNLDEAENIGVSFEDVPNLSFHINPNFLSGLIKNGEVNKNDEGGLTMRTAVKSRLAFGAVNTKGIIEAHVVTISNGVVILSEK